ncbi:PAS domain-containing protein [Sphingomonas changnyeongensis]|uniref:histidine kinase n=1 Tax=Sphingomonas changnyeongensis TaxID=2698679 RepID=A0A7Z2S5H1_9SPHN|nr:HWE histidine kinase domain-containing protein [Sphingomonas changnyeongensis]QHL90358.1 PAS domain-containing protein [Sphingomonas changnyeongensis]
MRGGGCGDGRTGLYARRRRNGARIRAHDWSSSPLGAPLHWPAPLQVTLGLCLQSSFPTAIYWGADHILLYNDAWSAIPGPRHPAALGRPARQVWPDIWDVIAPQMRDVYEQGIGFSATEQMLPMQRHGRAEETYWDYSFTPIRGEGGAVRGIFNQGREVTDRVLQSRRDRLLAELDDGLRQAATEEAALDAALALIGTGFGVARAGFAEIEEDGDGAIVRRCWTAGTLPLSGRFAAGAFGSASSAALRGGAVLRIENVADLAGADGHAARLWRDLDIAALLAAPVMTDRGYAGAIFLHSPVPRRWFDHDADLLRLAAGRLWRDLARTRAQARLRDSEQRHRLIFEQATDIMFTATLDGVITAANPAAGAALGLPAAGLAGRPLSDFLAPGEGRRAWARLRPRRRDRDEPGTPSRHDVGVTGADGRAMRWAVSSTVTLGDDRTPIGLHMIARDVTAERAFEERQRLLIDELNHRVKNSLALVQALARHSLRPGRDHEQALADFQARLAALAAAHDLLTREQWEGATLAELVRRATGPVAPGSNRLRAAGPHAELTPKAAVAVVMALHELSTNAVKYGALSLPDGRIDIGWRLDGQRLLLDWRELGGPPVARPSSRGFGIRMIERALASDLAARVRIDFDPAGLICTIDAPVAPNLRMI